jgi:hypothetical protein
MNKEEMFHDYLLICNMKAPTKSRAEILTLLFKNYHNSWRVIGVTENALLKFKDNNFKKIAGNIIQRAHLNNRHTIFSEMMSQTFYSIDEWWNFYHKNDETILALSSENDKVKECKIITIDQELGLFKRAGWSYRHTKLECQYLAGLYSEYIS